MKDKKITKLISETETNLKSISESLVDEILKEEEKTDRDHFDFGTYSGVYEETIIEMEPEEKPVDMIEEIAKNLSSELVEELASELFEEIEVEAEMQQQILETVEEQISHPEELSISEEVVDQMEDGAMKSYLSTMSKMKPVEMLEEKTDLLGGADDAVTQSQLNQATSQMMSKIQTALASLGGGGLGDQDVSNMINLEINNLDSSLSGTINIEINNLADSLGNIIGNLDSDLNADLNEINNKLLNLTTDSVPEGEFNLYYTTDRHDSDTFAMVDSDYVTERVRINTSLRFKGDLFVDVDSAPSSPSDGDMYLNDSDATAGPSWTGIAGETILQAQAVAWSEENSRWYAMGGIFRVDVVGIVEQATPVGSIMMWMGATSPDGWFILNGSSFNTTNNPKLHAYLTSNYPDYSSGTLPDYRGYFPGGHGALGMSPDMGGKTDATTGDPGLSVVSNGSHTHTATTTASTSVTIGGGGKVDTTSAGRHSHSVKFHKNKDNNTSNTGSSVNVTSEYHNNGSEFSRVTTSAGEHEHEVDLSGITANGSTTANTTLTNAGDHSHTLDGWDTRTMPNAFAINFMIKHD